MNEHQATSRSLILFLLFVWANTHHIWDVRYSVGISSARDHWLDQTNRGGNDVRCAARCVLRDELSSSTV